MAKTHTPVKDPILAQMEKVIAGEVQAPAPPAANTVPGPDPVIGDTKAPAWLKASRVKAKTTVVRCIVIDKDDHWNQEARVDLKGVDATDFTWGYYGQVLPVLVEDKDRPGILDPWYLPDAAGESSNRLYKGANPEGFRATFKHRTDLLQKLQVGLMVALVLGLFLIMFILINN